MTIPNMEYKPLLAQLHGRIPQNTMSELATTLQEIYRINRDGGHGSRRKVTAILLQLGVQSNE